MRHHTRPSVCMSYEEEDTCMSYEEEDTCVITRDPACACHMRRRIHASSHATQRVHTCQRVMTHVSSSSYDMHVSSSSYDMSACDQCACVFICVSIFLDQTQGLSDTSHEPMNISRTHEHLAPAVMYRVCALFPLHFSFFLASQTLYEHNKTLAQAHVRTPARARTCQWTSEGEEVAWREVAWREGRRERKREEELVKVK
jgi:hypothetical protein